MSGEAPFGTVSYNSKTSSPEPESETGLHGQDEDEDDDSMQITAPTATITSTIGTPLINTDAKTSRVTSASISNAMFPVVKVHSVVSPSSSSSAASSSLSEKRLHKAEMRKNRRNRKDKLLDFVIVSKEDASSGISRASIVTSSDSNSLMINTGKTGHYSYCPSLGEGGDFTLNHVVPNANNVQSTTNSRRKKNDVIKPGSDGKSRVGDLDDFGSLATTKSLLPPKGVDRLSTTTERVKISPSDTLIMSDRELNIAPKLSPLGTSPRKGSRKDDGWKEVTRNCNSRSKKVTVHASVISRVIGRGGCNINSIREASSAHVDIEKPQKGVVDRVITIKGSADATRMAHAMITALVQEPDKELVDIITRVKGKSTEKIQQVPEAIGDFSIGTFSNSTYSSQSSSSSGQKLTAKSGTARQATNSNAVVNGRPSAPNSAGVPQPSVWQNPSSCAGVPSSPRRSPQKQLPQSLIVQVSTSGPAYSPDKIIRQTLVADACHLTPPSTTITSMTFGTLTTVTKSSPPCVAVHTSTTENRQPQAMSSSVVGNPSQKLVNRPAGSNVRVLQRPTSGGSRSDPQPLPIVSSRMSTSTGSGTTSSNGTTTSGNFSTFHLWNNSSPTPILSSKKEDFASVAAAGVVSNLPSPQAAQAAPGTPSSTPNDPTKAPGYKAGMRTASPHSRQDQPSIISSLSYHLPVVNAEHPDTQILGFRGSLPSSPGIPSHAGLPSPAGDGSHMPPHMIYPMSVEHPGGFPNQHANYPQLHLMHPGLGSLVDQKEEYSTPHQPMTLPEIKSTLNPNAPDFRITGTGGNGPVGLINGYLPTLGDLRTSGDLSSGGCAGRAEDGGGNTNLNQMQVLAQLQQAVTAPGFMQMMAQQLINMDMLQQMQQQQRSASPSPQVASAGPGPGPPPHLGVHDTPGSPSLPCPVPGPTPPALSNFLAPHGLVRNVSPIASQHRPNSAPSVPDAASVPSVHPNIGPSMPACTPPLLDTKQDTEDRRVIRPIGGERAAHRKTPVTSASSGLGSSGDFNTGWSVPEMTKEWASSSSPQMTAAVLPTSVITSSVVTGSNMTYTLSQHENPGSAPGPESTSGFHESFNSGIDSTDPTVQAWRNSWSRTDI